MRTDIIDDKSANASETIKTINDVLLKKIGKPLLSSLPPGTENAAAKTTVAMRVATSMQDLAVSFIHFSPLSSNFLCSFVNNS
ncbi:hypothetical protein Nepgr_025157 [Nepenthes gracilis]|uniref:Uncharacterized protein n=1 Tax=Nepenthes gracilis TaxID=150966 RepID=A0AAD3T6D4_NEPGR|nr:hypothetical protein Nepgr_025157 [Nepenthes gracilis]